jgi:hypothetical protein
MPQGVVILGLYMAWIVSMCGLGVVCLGVANLVHHVIRPTHPTMMASAW